MPRALALFVVVLAVPAQAPEHARKLASAAQQSMREEHFAEAARNYEALLRLGPDNSEAHFALGVCYTQLDRLAEAAAQFRAYLKREPQSAQARAALGTVLMGQGLLAEAQPQLEHALRLDPSDAEVKRDLARVYDLQGEPARAVALLRSLVASSPGDSETRSLLAAASLKSGDFAEATRELDALLAMNPRSPLEIYVLAVRAWQKSGDFTKASEIAEQGMRLYPYSRRIEGVYLDTPPELLARRIETRMERLAATQPNSPGEMIALGRIIIDWPPAAEQLAGYAEAIASQAVRVAPRSGSAQYHHARCLGCLRRYTEAVAALQRALTLEPDGELKTLIYTRLGEFEDKQSHSERACQAFRTAMEVNRKLKQHDPDAACDYLKFLNQESMTEEARSIAEEILRWSPFHMPARLELAKLLGRESRWAEAIEEARLVIRNAEDETMLRSAHYFLARAYHATGREDLAKAEQSWILDHKATRAGGRSH